MNQEQQDEIISYRIDGKTLKEIADIYGVSRECIRLILKKYHITGAVSKPKPTKLLQKKQQDKRCKIDISQKEAIKILYYDMNMTIAEIAKRYNVSAQTMFRYMEKWNIERQYGTLKAKERGTLVKRGGSKSVAKKLTKEEFEELYILQDKSINEIAEMLDRSPRTIDNHRVLLKIPAKKSDRYKDLSIEEIKRLYFDEKRSLTDVANILGSNITKVVKYMKIHGLERRTLKESADLYVDKMGISKTQKPKSAKAKSLKISNISLENLLKCNICHRIYDCNTQESIVIPRNIVITRNRICEFCK